MQAGVSIILEKYAKDISAGIVKNIRNKKISNYKKSAVNASGALAKSVRYEVNEGGFSIYAYDYIFTLEQGGRSPSEVQREASSPGFFQDILQWTKDKKLNIKGDRQQAARAIVDSMEMKGDSIWQMYKGTPTGLVSDVLNVGVIAELATDLGQTFIDSVVSAIVQEFQSVAV